MPDISRQSIKPNEKIVRLRIICADPVDYRQHNAIFGVQDKARHVHEGKWQPNGDIHYNIEIRARYDPERKRMTFIGPWIYGTPGQQFLYLAWSSIDPDNPSPWERRMKIHLSSITWEQVEEVDRTGGVLESSVAGKDREGAPACASVTLLGEGWVVREIPTHEPIQPLE